MGRSIGSHQRRWNAISSPPPHSIFHHGIRRRGGSPRAAKVVARCAHCSRGLTTRPISVANWHGASGSAIVSFRTLKRDDTKRPKTPIQRNGFLDVRGADIGVHAFPARELPANPAAHSARQPTPNGFPHRTQSDNRARRRCRKCRQKAGAASSRALQPHLLRCRTSLLIGPP
jgi:hypothetical protein